MSTMVHSLWVIFASKGSSWPSYFSHSRASMVNSRSFSIRKITVVSAGPWSKLTMATWETSPSVALESVGNKQNKRAFVIWGYSAHGRFISLFLDLWSTEPQLKFVEQFDKNHGTFLYFQVSKVIRAHHLFKAINESNRIIMNKAHRWQIPPPTTCQCFALFTHWNRKCFCYIISTPWNVCAVRDLLGGASVVRLAGQHTFYWQNCDNQAVICKHKCLYISHRAHIGWI